MSQTPSFRVDKIDAPKQPVCIRITFASIDELDWFEELISHSPCLQLESACDYHKDADYLSDLKTALLNLEKGIKSALKVRQ